MAHNNTRQIRLHLNITATETHCATDTEPCQHLDRGYLRCDIWQSADLPWDGEAGEFMRLPECIAAEKRAQSA
jgi:hypothetical protein